MVKYEGLPDVNPDEQDVFETPDIDNQTSHLDNYEVLSDYSEPEEETEEIIRSNLSVSAAANRFAKATADTSESDFSGRVGKRKSHGGKRGKVSATKRRLPDREEYTLGTGKEGETKFQRFRRLMFEVQELSEELNVDATTEEDSTADPTTTTTTPDVPTKPTKKPALTQRQLLEQVSALQTELSRVGNTLGGPEALSNTFSAPSGTLTKQLETGKSLMTQLQAFKSLSLSDSSPSSLPSSSDQRSQTPSPNDNPTQSGTPTVTYELLYTPQTLKSTTLSKLTHLESRLTSLERLLGTSHLDPTDSDTSQSLLQSSGSLIGALERLDHHLALLSQPRMLDGLGRRVKGLTAEMERVAELRKKRELEGGLMGGVGASSLSLESSDQQQASTTPQTLTPDQERKINRLFLTLDRVDPIASVVPHLLARLQGLRSLHAEAAVFSESLKMLVREQER
ncbi:hypothetical protein HK097_010533, partial [Rhizophlyctis rosea]